MGRFKIFALLLSICLLSCSSSSSDDSGSTGEVKLSCSQTSIEAPANGGTYAVAVAASTGGWTATADENSSSWVRVNAMNTNKASGIISVTIDENTGKDVRNGAINVQLGSKQVCITITQTGKSVTPIEGGELVVPDGYKLVWNDEFNEGSVLKSSDWRHEVQKDHWVNNELQNYVNGSANGKRVTEIADGRLYIYCFKGSDGKIYSGRVYAHENEGWKYGIIEARIKLPKGKGTWPAFWMMPCNNDYSKNPWPHCGEIDIMEEVGVDANQVVSTIHCSKYNNSGTAIESAKRKVDTAESEFHVYRLDWEHDRMIFSVDGKELLNYKNDGTGEDAWPFDKNFYVILNLAWGGDWGGYKGVDESALPAMMEVDYVRVFQKK